MFVKDGVVEAKKHPGGGPLLPVIDRVMRRFRPLGHATSVCKCRDTQKKQTVKHKQNHATGGKSGKEGNQINRSGFQRLSSLAAKGLELLLE